MCDPLGKNLLLPSWSAEDFEEEFSTSSLGILKVLELKIELSKAKKAAQVAADTARQAFYDLGVQETEARLTEELAGVCKEYYLKGAEVAKDKEVDQSRAQPKDKSKGKEVALKAKESELVKPLAIA
nr:hypothetical protein CFP56_57289 [Quercus suber]